MLQGSRSRQDWSVHSKVIEDFMSARTHRWTETQINAPSYLYIPGLNFFPSENYAFSLTTCAYVHTPDIPR